MIRKRIHAGGKLVTIAAVALCAMMGQTTVANGQVSPSPFERLSGTVAIRLIASEGQDRPRIMRRTDGEVANIIVLDPQITSGRALSDAVTALLVMDAEDPLGRRRSNITASVARVNGGRVYPWAAEALQRLSGAEARRIERFGHHRNILVYLPPFRNR